MDENLAVWDICCRIPKQVNEVSLARRPIKKGRRLSYNRNSLLLKKIAVTGDDCPYMVAIKKMKEW